MRACSHWFAESRERHQNHFATLAGLEVDNISTPNSALDSAKLNELMHRLIESLIA